MILKPFMLRRIKKNVQNELVEKVYSVLIQIEKEVYCELTPRQKYMYNGIKKKIPVQELMEKFNSQSNVNVDSLMNLVMQLRKVF